jgi:N-methylhydantoinase A/oxoprolinase/acetone carboxylase beta subunit
MSIDGPAIIEEYDSTTYVAPKWTLTVEDDLLILRRAR